MKARLIKLWAWLKVRFTWYNWIPCKCGSRGPFKERVTDYLDVGVGAGPVLEYEVRCDKCDQVVNYWAHGYMQYPETYTERAANQWRHFKSYLKSFVARFKNMR